MLKQYILRGQRAMWSEIKITVEFQYLYLYSVLLIHYVGDIWMISFFVWHLLACHTSMVCITKVLKLHDYSSILWACYQRILSNILDTSRIVNKPFLTISYAISPTPITTVYPPLKHTETSNRKCLLENAFVEQVAGWHKPVVVQNNSHTISKHMPVSRPFGDTQTVVGLQTTWMLCSHVSQPWKY